MKKLLIITIITFFVVLYFSFWEYTDQNTFTDGRTIETHVFLLGNPDSYHIGNKWGYIVLYRYSKIIN